MLRFPKIQNHPQTFALAIPIWVHAAVIASSDQRGEPHACNLKPSSAKMFERFENVCSESSCLYFSSSAVLWTGEVWEFLSFTERHPSIIYNILLFGVTSALGQVSEGRGGAQPLQHLGL